MSATKASLKIAAAITLFPLLSCSTASQLGAERVDPTNKDHQETQVAPTGLIEDAITGSEFSLFPESVNQKLEQTLKTEKDKRRLFKALQNDVCDGKQPRITPTYHIHLIIPKSADGVSLDEATKFRAEMTERARAYIKDSFLMSAASPRNSRHYPDYMKKLIEEDKSVLTDHIEKLNGVKLDLPFLVGTKQTAIENYIDNLNQLDPRSGFIAIAFSDQRSAVLIPGIVPIYHVEWDNNDPKHFFSAYSKTGNDPNLQGFYTISDYGWRVKSKIGLQPMKYYPNTSFPGTEAAYASAIDDGAVIYPLHAATMTDLALFVQYFTFALPEEVICLINNQNHARRIGDDAAACKTQNEQQSLNNLRNWGYHFSYNEPPKFSPDQAIKDQSAIWEKILPVMTTVKEAPQESASVDSIAFDLTVDLSLLCEYGVPLTELLSH